MRASRAENSRSISTCSRRRIPAVVLFPTEQQASIERASAHGTACKDAKRGVICRVPVVMQAPGSLAVHVCSSLACP